MKPWIAALLVIAAGTADISHAQERSGAAGRQQRLDQQRAIEPKRLQRDSSDAERLNQLLRLREQGDRRNRQLRTQPQASQPAQGGGRRNGPVRTQ